MATKRQRKIENQRLAAQASFNEQAKLDRPEKFRKNIDLKPKTDAQREFVKGIRDSEVSVGIGPAGVGKTFCAATLAAQMIINNELDRIVLTRANVTLGKTIGMLPGTIEEKMTPLLLPILNVLKRQLGEPLYEYMMRKKKIEMLPIEYVRGLSFIDTFVIIDEAQNLEQDEVTAIVTRYESGKVVFLGDPTQHDLPGEPGIAWLEKFAKKHDLGMPVTRFGLEDVVRSSFVKSFLYALADEKAPSKQKAALLQG